jgi:hypothetical protein
MMKQIGGRSAWNKVAVMLPEKYQFHLDRSCEYRHEPVSTRVKMR